MPSQTKKPSLTFVTLALMVPVALLFDGIIAAPKLLDLIPYLDVLTVPANFMVGTLTSLFAYLTFWFWFHKHGIRFIKSPKRLLTFPVAFFIKLIPFLGALPTWTGAVVFIFLNVRAEDLLVKTEVGAKVVGGAAKVAGKLGANKQKMKEVAEKAKEVEQGAKETRERVAKAKKGELGQEGAEEHVGGQHYADTMQALQPGSEQQQRGVGGKTATETAPQGRAGQPAGSEASELSPYRGEGTTRNTKPSGDIGGPPVFHPSARESSPPGHSPARTPQQNSVGQQPAPSQSPQSARGAQASNPAQSGGQPPHGSPSAK